jgi:predicted RNA-binding protein with PUA-like domain
MEQARVWFLQANPKHYDIDAALGALDRIWWRVPQYTGEIHIGDVAVVWRSGKDAGIVGIGRVASEPQLRQSDSAERPFAFTTDEEIGDTTRVLVRVIPVPPIPKEKVRAIPALQQHQIVVAPMGTVFPLSADEWAALRPLLPAAPEMLEGEASALPPAFAWSQRAKGVLPMPGGYNGYLDSLRKVCTVVAEERPTPAELAGRLEAVLGVRATGARLRESFLRKVGIITTSGGVCRVGPWTEKWLTSGDDRILVGLLHSRCQFIGELARRCAQPGRHRTASVGRQRAVRYGLGHTDPDHQPTRMAAVGRNAHRYRRWQDADDRCRTVIVG